MKSIDKLNPCEEAKDWLKAQPSLEEAYANCERGDWLLWLAAKLDIDRKVVVLAACECAEQALKYVPAGEGRPRKATETARAWTRGEATLREVHAVADAAYAAAADDVVAHAAHAASDAVAYAAYAAYAASAAVAYAASAAADVIASAAADAVAYAADVVAHAAHAASDAAASDAAASASAAYATHATYAAARTESLKLSADIVRKHISFESLEAKLND